MGSYCIVICWERFKYNYCLVVIMCSLSLKTKRSMGNGLISGNAAGLFLGEVVWSVGWFLQSSRIFFQFFWPLELRLSNRTILIFLLMWHHLRLIFFLALGLYIYIYILAVELRLSDHRILQPSFSWWCGAIWAGFFPAMYTTTSVPKNKSL